MSPRQASNFEDYDDTVIFRSSYGEIPRLIFYGAAPFLLVLAAALFVRAVWFNGGVELDPIDLSPEAVCWYLCLPMASLSGLLLVLGIYRRFNPQQVVVTEDGLDLPAGRFTDRVVHIEWDNLTASMKSANLEGMSVYDVVCLDMKNDVKIAVSSLLFRRFDDFATFAWIVGDEFGQDWSIKGFMPGKTRGRKIKRGLSALREIDPA